MSKGVKLHNAYIVGRSITYFKLGILDYKIYNSIFKYKDLNNLYLNKREKTPTISQYSALLTYIL